MLTSPYAFAIRRCYDYAARAMPARADMRDFIYAALLYVEYERLRCRARAAYAYDFFMPRFMPSDGLRDAAA